MEWLKTISSGYQKVNTINKENTLSYKDVKNDLDKILQFGETEKRTQEEIKQIKDYFEKFVGLEDEGDISNKEDIVAKARAYGKEMDKYSNEFYEDIAVLRIDPDRVDARIAMLEERIQRFRTHGRYAGVIGVVLLACAGGLTSWQMYGIKATTLALGVAVGFTVGVLAFSIFYFGYLGQKKAHLLKWKDLKKESSKVPEIKEEIERKKPITRDLKKLLLQEVMEDQIIFPSEDIVKNCKKYLEN